MRKFSEKEKEFVLKSLENKIPLSRFVRSVLHTDNRMFDKMCKDIGIEYPRFRKNKIWDNPFSDVNNPHVQYWLGWLATDGHISENDYKCQLFLSDKDRDVIEKFQKFLGGNLSIHTYIHYNKYPQTGVKFRNERIVKFLNNLGFNSKKTFNFYPNFNISWDYIRGCFEGDGYIRNGEIDILGASEKHIKLLYDFIIKYNIDAHFITRLDKTGNIMYHIQIHKMSDIQKFVDYLYKDADIFMNRKYLKARAASNSSWKALKFGEPASGIPSQASNLEEGVTT